MLRVHYDQDWLWEEYELPEFRKIKDKARLHHNDEWHYIYDKDSHTKVIIDGRCFLGEPSGDPDWMAASIFDMRDEHDSEGFYKAKEWLENS